MISIALDAMGGDHAPRVIVDGAVAAGRHLDGRLLLVGPTALLEAALETHRDWRALGIEIVDAPDVVANVDAAPKCDAAAAGEALVRQVTAPVRWEDVVRCLALRGVTTYVEVGPGTVPTGLVKKIHKEAKVLNFAAPDGLAAIEGALRGSHDVNEKD